jgi:thymidylate synthase (FAD)
MKIKVEKPSYEIWDDHDNHSLPERLERAGRICYKSEDQIRPGTADKFVERVIKLGHNSVLEMGSMTFDFGMEAVTEYEYEGILTLGAGKYLQLSFSHMSNRMLVTGSYRAFREFYLNNTGTLLDLCMAKMVETWPSLGVGLTPIKADFRDLGINPIAPTEKMLDYRKHKHVMVKFNIGRHTSHELVRHRPMSVLQSSQRYCNYSLGKFGSVVTVIEPVNLAKCDYDLWHGACDVAARTYFKLLENNQPQVARTVLPNSCKTEVLVYANLVQWEHIFKLRDSARADPSMVEVMRPLHAEFRERMWL